MEENYELIDRQLGNDKHSKVYIIQGNLSGKEYIVKIYEESRLIYLKNETNILGLLNQNHSSENYIFYIMFKRMNYNPQLFNIPKEIKMYNIEFLFYDYLPKLSLCDYIINNNLQVKEIHAKFLCYKLLKSIEQLHSINICHNKLDISNIMFDEEFNPKIIHFSEANIINDKTELNKDLFCLGKILAKLLTLGKFSSINFNKKYNKFIINGSDKEKKLFMEESKFWKTLKSFYNINISGKFIGFFDILLEAKKSKKLVNIHELYKNEWLNEINDDIKIIEDNFKNDFKELYKIIIEDNIKKSKIDIDIKNILDVSETKTYFDNDLKYPNFNKSSNYSKDNQEKNEDITNYKNYHDLIGNCNNIENKKEIKENSIKEESDKKDNYIKKENMKAKKRKIDFEENLEILNYDYDKSQMKGESEEKEKSKIKKLIEENELISSKERKNNEITVQNEYYSDIVSDKPKMNKMESHKKTKIINYNSDNCDNNKSNKNNYFTDNVSKIEEKFFKPKINDFNYIEINIKNVENKDINKAINNFINNFKSKIKEQYEKTEIKVYIKMENEKDLSFLLCYELLTTPFDDEIEFLDDEFETKIKSKQGFRINVELVEGNKNLYSIDKINQYYIIFNKVSMDNEYFYEHLKILKKLAKNILLKK